MLNFSSRALLALFIFVCVTSAVAQSSSVITSPPKGQVKVVVIPLFGDDAASKWRGLWVTDTAYKKSEIIEFDGSSYIAVLDHWSALSNIPPEAGLWDLVAASGANGAAGNQGDKGEDSTVAGPKGEPGADSMVAGPKGDTGNSGAASMVAGPKGDTGNAGAASTVAGPKGDTGEQGTAADALAAICVALGSTADCDLATVIAGALPVYAIGETGPAGGIVFHVTNGGSHGLEAAPGDALPSKWGCDGTNIYTSTGLGSGDANTSAIVAKCTSEADPTAAERANSYELNGFTDWFLPSRDELNLLYLQKPVVGGFASSGYWSSSQASASGAWLQYFGSGNQSGLNKNLTYGFRAVRAF